MGNVGDSYVKQGMSMYVCMYVCIPVQHVKSSLSEGIKKATVIFESIVYDKCGYIEIVGGAAEQAMVDAVQEVKNLPQYNADEGEVSHNVAFMN